MIKAASELMTAAQYSKVIRPLLPKEAFRAYPGHLGKIAFHIGCFVASIILIREVPWWMVPFLAPLAGHSLACMGIIAHDVSHFSIVTSRLGVRSLELCLFGPNAVPPTIWRRIHNQAHHAETNTEKDPDRPFFEDERTNFTSIYAHLFYPGSFRILPRILVFLHFGPYLLRNIHAALAPGDHKLEIVPYKPKYSMKMKLSIVLEGVWIILLQVFIWHFVGGWWRYLWAGPVSMVVTSAIAKGYIFTNHFLNPHCAHTDPVVGSTSLILPGWIDWLHNNVSYHAEHHIFPGMNSRYLPLVSDLLKEHFPERYQRLTYLEAWHRLFQMDTWQTRTFEESHNH